jgi:hypothetical protein
MLTSFDSLPYTLEREEPVQVKGFSSLKRFSSLKPRRTNVFYLGFFMQYAGQVANAFKLWDRQESRGLNQCS